VQRIIRLIDMGTNELRTSIEKAKQIMNSVSYAFLKDKAFQGYFE